MKITLKEDYLDKLLEDIETIRFTADGGCACGDFGYQLDENLFLIVYRSCRKSGGTPENQLWHINDFQFYKNVTIETDTHNGYTYVSSYQMNDEDYIDAKMDEYQKQLILGKLKEITTESWGEEFR